MITIKLTTLSALKITWPSHNALLTLDLAYVPPLSMRECLRETVDACKQTTNKQKHLVTIKLTTYLISRPRNGSQQSGEEGLLICASYLNTTAPRKLKLFYPYEWRNTLFFTQMIIKRAILLRFSERTWASSLRRWRAELFWPMTELILNIFHWNSKSSSASHSFIYSVKRNAKYLVLTLKTGSSVSYVDTMQNCRSRR